MSLYPNRDIPLRQFLARADNEPYIMIRAYFRLSHRDATMNVFQSA
jgi:hypothetical protein